MEGLSPSSLLFGGSVPQRNATTEGLRIGCVAVIAHFASLSNAGRTSPNPNPLSCMRAQSTMSELSSAQSAPCRTSHRTSSSLLFAAATLRGVRPLRFSRRTSLCAPFSYSHLHISRPSAQTADNIGKFRYVDAECPVVDAPLDLRY